MGRKYIFILIIMIILNFTHKLYNLIELFCLGFEKWESMIGKTRIWFIGRVLGGWWGADRPGFAWLSISGSKLVYRSMILGRPHGHGAALWWIKYAEKCISTCTENVWWTVADAVVCAAVVNIETRDWQRCSPQWRSLIFELFIFIHWIEIEIYVW